MSIWPSVISSTAGLAGGIYSDAQSSREGKLSRKYQKQFAQHGVSWKVADARRAGINPLYALGASTHSYQPTRAFGSETGKAMAQMGQDVSRAMVANASKADRAIQSQILQEQLKTAKLHNMGLEIKIQQASQPQGVPPTGDPLTDAMNRQGQGSAGNNTLSGQAAIQVKPDQYTPMKQMGVSAATSPLRKHYIDDHGWVWNVLNQEAAESIESDQAAQMKMMVHEGVKWIRGSDRKVRPKISIPKGYTLKYFRSMNQWRVIKIQKSIKHPPARSGWPHYNQRYN